MALVPFEPFRHVENWKRDLDKLFNQGLPSVFGLFHDFGTPRVDVYENENEVVAHCEIAGLKSQEDVHIHVEEQSLTIHGSVHRIHESDDQQMHRKERFSGRFERTISLPSAVQSEGTSASYKNGVLEVRMPKIKKDVKKIDVHFQ
jgi:HSP20 family protein